MAIFGALLKIGLAVGAFIFRRKIKAIIRGFIGSPRQIGQTIGSAIGTELAITSSDEAGLGADGGGLLVGQTIFLETLVPASGKKLFRKQRHRACKRCAKYSCNCPGR